MTPAGPSDAATEKQFPIMESPVLTSVPWAFIAPHERQAQANHDQSLQRLAERGGLCLQEALAVVQDTTWTDTVYLTDRAAASQLRALLDDWHRLRLLNGYLGGAVK